LQELLDMAGHNKWSKIRHRKAVVDKRRGKAWSMCSRAIIVAARTGGGDPSFNYALRAAMDEARYHNMPADNVERAIKKGLGGAAGDDYENCRYEGYGAGGVAIVIDAFTNNRARTAGDVRLILSTNGGKLGTTGCVSHQFDQKGRILVTGLATDEDVLIELALGVGADDVRRIDDEQPQGTVAWEVLCAPTEFAHVRQGLSEKLAPPIPVSRNPTERVQPPLPGSGKLAIGESGIEMLPLALTAVAGEDAKSVLELVEELEDNEDIKKVYTNADIADDVLAAMGD